MINGQVMDNCNNLPQYTPVAMFSDLGEVGSSGVFINCLGSDGFQVKLEKYSYISKNADHTDHSLERSINFFILFGLYLILLLLLLLCWSLVVPAAMTIWLWAIFVDSFCLSLFKHISQHQAR